MSLQTSSRPSKEQGGIIADHEAIFKQIQKEENIITPTSEQKEALVKMSSKRYLAVVFLLKADKGRYGSLVKEI